MNHPLDDRPTSAQEDGPARTGSQGPDLENDEGSRGLWILAALCIVTLFFSFPYIQTLGDDTFIYMRSVARFVEGNGFQFNLGQPIYVFNSVTWFFSWVLGTLLLGDLDLARYVLSIVFHLFAFLCVALLTRHFVKNRLILIVALTTIFFDPFYLRWLWGGWEVSLKIAMAALALYALVRISAQSRHRDYFIAGLVTGAAFLTRPEMLVLVLAGVVYLLLNRPLSLPGLALFAIGCSLIALPWVAYAMVRFGTPVSHTVFAKTSGDALSGPYLLASIRRYIQLMFVPSLWLASLFLVAVVLMRRRILAVNPRETLVRIAADPATRNRWLDVGLLSFWVAASLGYIASGAAIISVKMIMFSPFVAVFLAALLDILVGDRVSVRDRRAQIGTTVIVAAIVATSLALQGILFFRYSLFNADYRQGEDYRLVEFAQEANRLTSPGDVIGLTELGVLSFYMMDRQILDFQGLGTPEIIPYLQEYGRPDYAPRYLDDRGAYPEYLIFVRNSSDRPVQIDEVTQIWEYDYRPILIQDVQRIGGDRQLGDVVYVLFERIGPTKVSKS